MIYELVLIYGLDLDVAIVYLRKWTQSIDIRVLLTNELKCAIIKV